MIGVIWWIIVRKSTGEFLPEGAGAGGRGGSHAEFSQGPLAAPRLFHKRSAARQARTAWLGGKWYSDGDGSVDCVVVPERLEIAEDIDVVPVQLTFPSAEALIDHEKAAR